MFLREEVLGLVKETHKKMKWLAIVISILMIIMGAVMFFLPESAVGIAMWLMVAGLIFSGIMDIISFCKMPKGTRDGWSLACGIIWIVIALILILGRLSASTVALLVAWGNVEMIIAFMVAFTCIFNGIKNLCSCSAVRAMGGSPAGCVLSGILGIIVGIIVLTYPIGAIITLTVFYGLFLVINGISMLCLTLSFK